MSTAPLRLERRLFAGFVLLFLVLVAASAWQWRGGAPVSANLLDILPEAEQDIRVEQARQDMDAPLQRELVLLIRHPQVTVRLPDWAGQLQASGLFRQVDYRLDTRLEQVARQLLDGRSYLVPLDVRQQLAADPGAYVASRVQSLFDPVTSFSLVSLEQDWLGLTTAIQYGLQQHSRVQADSQGYLYVTEGDSTWYLVRLEAQEDGFAGNGVIRIAQQIAILRQQVEQDGGELLAGGGLLFNADSRQQAQGEIQWLGSLSLVGAMAVILLFFRRIKSLLAALPAIFGLWLGATVCIAVFGQIHAITLVLGVSLIGVTIDYPMHYMSKVWGSRNWNSSLVLRATLPGLTLGMACNAIGYLALAFTPFPALTQVAVFSVAGVFGAWLCTLCCLPWLLAGQQSMQPWRRPLGWMQQLLDWHARVTGKLAGHWWLLLAGIFVVTGLARLEVQNDLRQWVVLEPELLRQAGSIGELTGQQPTSQFILVHGNSERQTLSRLERVLQQLEQFRQQGFVQGHQSVLDVLAGLRGVPDLATALAGMDENSVQPLLELGADPQSLWQEIRMLQDGQPPAVSEALAGPLGEPWRLLWRVRDGGEHVALVRLQGLQEAAPLETWSLQQEGVVWVDRPGQLNRLFVHTQTLALWAKVLASAGILVVLTVFIGWRGALRTLGISLLAALLAAATLGWLGIAVTLFSVFGFLLVTAIGVDYAVMMYEGVGGAATSLLGALLAAVTTWLSFGLLILSATPAVSSFGLAVSLGLVFCCVLAPWAMRRQA